MKTTPRKRTPKTQDKGEATAQEAQTTEKPPQKKRQTRKKAQSIAQQAEQETAVATTNPPVKAQSSHQETESTEKSNRKKRQTRKKAPAVVETPGAPNFLTETKDQKIEPTASEPPPSKKRQGRVGQRKPKRDPVGP